MTIQRIKLFQVESGDVETIRLEEKIAGWMEDARATLKDFSVSSVSTAASVYRVFVTVLYQHS